LALAESAKKCEFQNGRFEWDCPQYKEWSRESDDLFESANGNATLLKMLEDADVRSRALVADRGFTAGRTFFADKKRAERLLKVIDKERETKLLSSYGKFAAHIDGEKILGRDLKALTQHPSMELRSSFAEHVLPQHPNAFSLEIVKTMLDDADWSVRRAALRSLSANGRTRPNDAICALLKTQLSRDDKLVETAIDAGSSSKCPGMVQSVIAEVEKRATDPDRFASSDLAGISWSLSSICWRGNVGDDVKKRVFDVAKKVTPKLSDTWRKRSWIDLFRRCDLARDKEALQPFAKDKEKDVADRAKEELKRVDEELKQNKK